MKNVNRDYLVTVDAKTAAIKPPKDMKFFITDILTCNIFFQLVFNDSGNLINAYAPNEDASNYTLTLRILKPDNTTKEVPATLLNEGSNFFIADLEPSCTDYLGVYQCELFIDTEINGRAERSTTDSFTYEVIKSVFTAVDEIIEGDPNYPGILDSFATRDYVTNAIKNMDLLGFATRDYVNQVIVGGEFDLSEYVTDEELNQALANLPNNGGGDIDLSDYVTEQELAEALVDFASGGTVDLTGYVTDSELEEALSVKADKEHSHDAYATKMYVNDAIANANFSGDIELDGYVTDEELNSALTAKADSVHTHSQYVIESQIPTTLPANGGNSDTVDGFNIWVGTQGQYYGISTPSPTTLYFIKEEE